MSNRTESVDVAI